MDLELPGWLIPAFNVVGLPWPGIDEVQLRGWAESVRTFARDMTDSSARTHKTVAELADSSQSSFTTALAASWEQQHQLVGNLQAPLNDFADALDGVADAVVTQKNSVIGAVTTLADELNDNQVRPSLTLGPGVADEPGQISLAREAVQAALEYLENELTGNLGSAVQQVSDSTKGCLASLHDDAVPAPTETRALKLSYKLLHEAAQSIRNNSTETENTGKRAYAENVRRDLVDSTEGSAGDGGRWQAVVQAAEQALLDVAGVLFTPLSEAISDHQRTTADAVGRFADEVRTADDSPREPMSAHERAEYQAGARLAKSLDEAVPSAAWRMAQHAGDPYFTAGLLNNLNVEQIIAIMTWPNSAYPPPDRTDPAIVNAMAAGTLSSRTMRELVAWLTAPAANSAGNQFMTNPLLREIAENRSASARLIAFIDPTKDAGSAQIKVLLQTYAGSGAENSILLIMANAISTTSPAKATPLIKSLVTDLSVLDSGTISQSGLGLSAFMKASAEKLLPPIPSSQIAKPNFPDDWYNKFSDKLRFLAPLLNEIGAAYQGHVEDVTFWQGVFEGVAMSAALAAFPVDAPLAGGVAVGAAEGAVTAALQPYLHKGASFLFPSGEDGAEAQQAYWQQLQKIVIVAGVVRLYTAAGDKAGAESLLKNPRFYQAVNTWVTFHGERSTYDSWLSGQKVRLPDGKEIMLQDMMSQLAGGVDPGTFQ